MIKFSILISTKNRLDDLKVTLQKIHYLVIRDDVECIICDDGSDDGTSAYISKNYPFIKLITHSKSKGYLFCRNMLLKITVAKYAISLDDDAHLITVNPLEKIEQYFIRNKKCGLLALRIFWDIREPIITECNEQSKTVNSFVGCGHVWRMDAWNKIPNYPEWFEFYGEENFASLQLFKNKIEVHYFPQVLVNHRVNFISRKKSDDYYLRQRRSFSSGWYLYFMFYPLSVIPRKILYTLFIQLKNKTFRGDFKSTKAILLAIFDVFKNMPKCINESNRLTTKEYKLFCKLEETKIYWIPEIINSKKII